MVPRGARAITASALGCPTAVSRVPSIGSTATSVPGPAPSPTCSPLNSIGASSFSPSPITTTPSIDTVSIISRIASTAAWSAAFLSPWPIHLPAASAAASVTRTSSIARFRSGRSVILGPPIDGPPPGRSTFGILRRGVRQHPVRLVPGEHALEGVLDRPVHQAELTGGAGTVVPVPVQQRADRRGTDRGILADTRKQPGERGDRAHEAPGDPDDPPRPAGLSTQECRRRPHRERRTRQEVSTIRDPVAGSQQVAGGAVVDVDDR